MQVEPPRHQVSRFQAPNPWRPSANCSSTLVYILLPVTGDNPPRTFQASHVCSLIPFHTLPARSPLTFMDLNDDPMFSSHTVRCEIIRIHSALHSTVLGRLPSLSLSLLTVSFKTPCKVIDRCVQSTEAADSLWRISECTSRSSELSGPPPPQNPWLPDSTKSTNPGLTLTLLRLKSLFLYQNLNHMFTQQQTRVMHTAHYNRLVHRNL